MSMAKPKAKDTSANPSPFGSDELAAPHVGDDAHEEEGFHGHAGYQSERDMQRRIDVATGNGPAVLDTRPE
jgi:hypothetical protein